MIINKNLERPLRTDMSHQEHDFDPVECDNIIADGHWHTYTILVNGQEHQAQYIAFLNPFPTEEESLLCVYGLVNDRKRYTYLSHPQKSQKAVDEIVFD